MGPGRRNSGSAVSHSETVFSGQFGGDGETLIDGSKGKAAVSTWMPHGCSMDADESLMLTVEGGSQVENGAPPSSPHPSSSPVDSRPSFPATAEQSHSGNDTLHSELRARLPAVMNGMFLLKFSPKNFFDMIESV